TVPNTVEFAEWVGRTKRRPVHIIATGQRPVPLEHSLFVDGDFHKFVDSHGNFLMRGYQGAVRAARERDSRRRRNRGGAVGGASHVGAAQERNEYIKLLRRLQRDGQLPAVVFAFSRRRCSE